MILQAGVRTLDRIRALVLRPLIAVRPLRQIYVDRSGRLALLHAMFACAALLLALTIPLWQLLLGPALFGYAHLLAGVRHVPAAIRRDPSGVGLPHKALGLTLAACASHILYRFAQEAGWLSFSGAQQSEWQGLGMVDGAFVALLCIGFAFLRGRQAASTVWMVLLLVPFLFALGLAPLETAGALVLLHNLVGYAYWIALAEPGKSRRRAAGAMLTVLASSALLLAGSLDAYLPLPSSETLFAIAGLSVHEVGQSILPHNGDPVLWQRLVCAFAFGQSCHYFVWLKAIPETRQRKRVPHTFRRCLRTLETELTGDGAHMAVYAIGVSFLLWLFIAIPDVRRFYFLFAGFHGLMELAGLPHLLPTLKGKAASQAR